MPQPAYLAELRVVEAAGGIAAAYAGKMLRDAGATVTLVEPPGGAALRRRKAAAMMGRADPLGARETGALFGHLHRGKRIVAAGDADLDALLGQADLLVTDDGFAALGRSADAIAARHPALSLIEISPWGADGPLAGAPATEFTLQAETGSLAARGYADRPPIATGGELGDYIAGSVAAIAALAAWRVARADGHGHRIDVSQFEAMLICLQAYQYIHGELEPRELSPTSVDIPGIERASDGWVGYATITDAQWRAFAKMIGHPELGEDDAVRYGNQRFAAMERIHPLIAAYTEARTVDQLVAEAVALRIPVTPMGDAVTVRQMPHFRERGVFAIVAEGHEEPRPPYLIGPADATATPPAARATPGPQAPLAGLRVLDLSAFWAGPMAGFLFSALGAEVLKVESVQRPDGMRYASGFVPQGKPLWECSPIFLGANSGKTGLTLDLTRPAGVDLLKRLIADSDVLIENFSPRVMEGFGLGWDVIHAVNPALVMLRMPAFGLDGPWRDRTGFAMTMEQVSGMAALGGYADRPPVPPRGAVDPIGGINGAFAVLCALEQRARDGQGRLVEASLAEAGIAVSAEAVIDEQVYGAHLERAGNSGPAAAPQGVLACGDGEQIALSVADDGQWRGLAGVVGPDLDRDDWRDVTGRRADEAPILDIVGRWCAGIDRETALDRLRTAGVPAAPLRNQRRLADHPQLVARGFFSRLAHPVVGTVGFPHAPFRINGAYPRLDRPAPLLGEHNREVLHDRLGLTDHEIADLARDAVIGTRPAHA